MPALSELAKARRKLILKWRRFLGLCIGCGNEAYGNSMCSACQNRATARAQSRRKKYKEYNLCRECGKNRANSGGYRCDTCIDMMRSRKKKRVCSSDGCYNEAALRIESCQECYDTKQAEKQSCKVYFIECYNCKKLFTSKHKWTKHCSLYCSKEFQMVNPIIRNCTICGKTYKLRRGKNFDKACSIPCRREMKKNIEHKRRMLMQESFIENVSTIVLFKRDNGECQLCGMELDLIRQVPDKLAITIDHVIPVSKGGEHSYNNTQLACFHCNSSKGNRFVG